jgi:hypothetical protein
MESPSTMCTDGQVRFLKEPQISHLFVAHPPRPSNFSHLHRPSNEPRWEVVGFRWEKGDRGSKPKHQFCFYGCQSGRCQRRSSGIPLYNPPQWSTGRTLHPVRRDRPSTIGVEGQVGGSKWVKEGCAGVEQGIRGGDLERGYVLCSYAAGECGTLVE